MAQASETENPLVLPTAQARVDRPAPRFHNPSGLPELWNTIASCFDDMLSARNDLGRPSFGALAAAHSALTGKHEASTTPNPEPSTSITAALTIDTSDGLPQPHVAGSSRAYMQLPPMPEPLVKNDLDDPAPTSVMPRQRTMTKSHFIESLFQILEDASNTGLASWSTDGDAFIVHNIPAFQKRLLPKYYRHSKFSSFVRQICAYGFRRAYLTEFGKAIPAGVVKARKKETETLRRTEYFHPNFKRNRKDLLPLIARKMQRQHEEHESPAEDRAMSAELAQSNVKDLSADGEQEENHVQGLAPDADQVEGDVQGTAPANIEDNNLEDDWKAILGPAVSNERGDASATSQASIALYAASQHSTQTNSPEDSVFGDYAKNYTPEEFISTSHEPVSLIENLDHVLQELPQDPQTLLILLQKTQIISFQIQERLRPVVPSRHAMSPGPSLANWPGVSTGWNGAPLGHQNPFTLAFSSASPYAQNHSVASPFAGLPF